MSKTPEVLPMTKPKATMIQDTELAAMNRIAKLLAGLEDAARSRVLAWVSAKFAAVKEDVKPCGI